jgi:TonB family protein
MATDTARIKLELASGRGEITAPFHHTAQRKRTKPDATVIADQPPAAEQVVIAVPLADVTVLSEFPGESLVSRPTGARVRPHIEPRTWIAFVAALVVVAAAVWWVMSQRAPDIDPREIIQRSLSDAQAAMGEGRYTDPPERSALHYYSTVLALDPNNSRAVAGIDAIADRYVTDARVLMADQRIAEAGVAIEKARRIRPHHMGLVPLDTMLRIELKKMLATSSTPVNSKPVEELLRQVASKPVRTTPPPAKMAAAPARTAVDFAPKVTIPLAEKKIAKEDAAPLPALLAAVDPTPTLAATNVPVPTPPAASDNASGSGVNIEESATVTTAATALPVEPKLIKMVQPEYPQEAVMRGIEGWVDVSLDVSAAGDVVASRIEDSSRGRLFNRAALAAVQQWKYEPRGAQATTETVLVRLKFQQAK